MNPFSVKLKALRESRGLLQKTFAIELGVSPTYLSALERGRKAPPQNEEFFKKLKNCLGLSDQETSELREVANAIEVLGTLVVGASPFQVAVAVTFASRLISLHPNQLRAIQAILDMTEYRTALSAT